VIFHIDNGTTEVVPFELLGSSKVLGALLTDLHLKQNIELDIKPEFTEAFHYYVDFLFGHKPTINTAEELIVCLAIEDYYEDTEFLIYLVTQAYKFWSIILPYLPDNIEVWLRTPYEFVPTSLMSQVKFFNDWIAINANKRVVLDGNEVYHTKVSYYTNGSLEQLDIYHTINRERGLDMVYMRFGMPMVKLDIEGITRTVSEMVCLRAGIPMVELCTEGFTRWVN